MSKFKPVIILGFVLIVGIVFSVVQIILASPAAPNPGHSWSQIGDVETGDDALPVSRGGTGLTSPGTSGNVLTSNGTVWTSAAPSGGAPGGSDTQVQYNNAGSFGGAANVKIVSNNLRLESVSTPSTPAADGIVIFGRKVAGRNLPAFISPSGLDSALQPLLARNRIVMWLPAGNATTVTAIGAAALSATGTATAANVATTSRHTWMKRVEYLVTTASTTAVAGFRNTVAQFGIGGSAGDGGFLFVCRWGPATGVATTTNRAFVGMTSATAAPTDVEPSTLTNMLGFGWNAADTNIQWMHNDGSGTATKVDLGGNFPVPTVDRTKVYEAAIFVAPNGSTIYYEFTDLATSNVATGSVTTNIPSNTTLLAPRGWMSVGGTSSVIGIALMSLYIETDY